jgi:hypothetical protein
MTNKEEDAALDECTETVRQLEFEKEDLEKENKELRQSADAFGELAERLAVKLRHPLEE